MRAMLRLDGARLNFFDPGTLEEALQRFATGCFISFPLISKE
jgi:hypothetical protein